MKPQLPSLLLCGLLARSAMAQPATAPVQIAIEAEKADREARIGSKKVAPDSGFYWLLRAAESLGDNPAPMPVIEAGFTPAQQLAYDREFAAHYAAHYVDSLKLLRRALAKPILRPVVNGQPFETQMNFFAGTNYDASFRQLARALDSEANVRLADGDAAGALNSHLDCLELGVVTSDGTLSDFLGGGAPCESIGRLHIEPVLARLDAPSCRAAATRLSAIEDKRPAFASLLRAEADSQYRLILPALTGPGSRRALETPEGRAKLGGHEGNGPTEAQAREWLGLSPAQLRRNIDRFYDAAIANAALPYQSAKTFAAPVDVDFQTAYAANIIGKPDIRFLYERGALQTHLLQCALQLRAIKLETGAYPTTFEAGIDPFSPSLQPLKYRSDGKTYALYSVGPDGRDNGGALIQSIATNQQNGIKSLSNRVTVDALGDISAPIF